MIIMGILKKMLVLLANLITYFFLQFIGALLEFAIWGSGPTSAANSKSMSLFMVGLQICLNILLFMKRKFITNIYFLVINIIMLIGLYVYFVIYIPSTIGN